jgi:hypothetical protein
LEEGSGEKKAVPGVGRGGLFGEPYATCATRRSRLYEREDVYMGSVMLALSACWATGEASDLRASSAEALVNGFDVGVLQGANLWS